MKIVVIGGTGLIGSNLVTKLGEHGHEAIPASPSSSVNTLTGEGLTEVLEGTQVVVDVSNAPSWEDEAVLHFFQTSTSNLLQAEASAGVGHHVALSVVGADRLKTVGYMRAKVAQEKLIKESALLYSIVRATQFFEFIDGIADSATVNNQVHIAPVAFQPVAARDVANALARVAVGAPLQAIQEIAGPAKRQMDEFIRASLTARNDPRQLVIDPHGRYFGAELAQDDLVPGDGAALARPVTRRG